MKRLSYLPCTKSRERGFAFSIDATLGAILFLSVILVIISISSSPVSVSTLQVNQLASDLFFSMNKTGFILSALDTNAPSQSLSDIYNKSRSLLPANFDLQLRLTQFDLNSATCQQQKNFGACFSEAYSATTGPTPPIDELVFAGERVYIKRQPESGCDTNAQLAEYPLGAFYGELYLQSVDENFENLLIFDVNTVPEGEFACDQNILVTLSITVPENIRKPVDMMLVLDRSGSMSWSGIGDNFGGSVAVWGDGNTVFPGAGSAIDKRVRSYDVSNPLLPVSLDSIDPGNLNDIHGRSGVVFVTDTSGTDEVYAYDSSNPSNLALFDSISFESVYGLFASGNYVYVAGDRTGGGNSRGLYIVDATNPSNLQYAGKLNLANAADVFVDGNTAYVARLSDGLSTVDVSDPDNPVLHDTIDPGGTNEGVFVDGNYAYVAAGALGLAVINAADPDNLTTAATHDTPDYAYNLFKTGQEVYISDDSSLYIADVSNPQSPVFARSFSTPYGYTDIHVFGDYAFLAGPTWSLLTVDIIDGPRINNAQVAANDFVDFNGWKFPPDQIGLVSFNSSATTNRQLSSDGNSVKSAIDALVATGGTDIADGINAGTTELTSVRANPNALKFQILLSDGQSNQGDANVAAQNAANNNIVIYSIAFGADADSVLLSNVAQITGGKYYAASDENALQEVFELISKDIEETARDANIVINLPSGELIIDEGSGYIVDGNIVFDANTIEPGVPWVGSYTVVFPCSHAANCGLEAVTFPGPNTKFNYIDSNGNNRSVDFNAQTTVDFLGRDLSVQILDGEIISETEVLLDVNVSNTSDLNSGPTDLKFYLNDTNGQLLRTENVPALCGSNDDSCNYFNFELYNDTDVGQTGLIYAVINDQNTISECPLHNIDSIYCLDAPKTQYYLLEYWVWKK
ncbi:MAG: VWA domain-containing protein [Candidatus Diapherotrites archaeon]|nr:VWA domain-containing protein [Candidatus Diapherotrites archaeon]